MIRVLIADDAAPIREALRELVDEQAGMEVVGLAADAAEAIGLAAEVRPDVALLDVRMPGDGHRAARAIVERSPRTRIVALSAHEDRASVVGMISAGACSFVTKGSRASDVVQAVQRAAQGDSVLSESVAREVVGELNDQLRTRERELLDRERKVARVRDALVPGALDIVYQPIFDLNGRRRLGIEALSRFAAQPYRTPDVWFADAWEVGLGVDLEVAAVREALRALEVLPSSEFLALNVSPATVSSARFEEVLPAGSHSRLN